MFVWVKRSGPREYLQIVENFREGRKVRQRVIANLGRLDILRATGALDSIATSLAQLSENVAVISGIKEGNQKVEWAKEWGSFLVFRRLWQQMELDQIIRSLKRKTKCEFDVERSVFYTVLHRLTEPGSDLKTSKWLDNIFDPEGIKIRYQHLLRAMGYLSGFKEEIEDALFLRGRTLLDASIDLVFFDTTSIYFEGEGPEGLAEYGHSKDHRPDRKQIIIGVVMNKEGDPICCEYWPGNMSDVKALLEIVEVLKGRFRIRRIILVCDKGMVSESNLEKLEKERIDFIVGVRLRADARPSGRNVKEVREEVLSKGGRYREVEDNLRVKEVFIGGKRYIICVNPEEARKDQKTREKILSDLEEKLRRGAKELIGNKGYRRYLKVEKDAVKIDEEELKQEERFDGKFVLLTSLKTQNSGTQLSSEGVAKSYKSLWEVEHAFRTLKDVLETRPIFHRKGSHVKGHVFCSYLALCLLIALRKSLREHNTGLKMQNSHKALCWDDVIRDLRSFRIIKATFSGKTYLMRTEFKGTAHRCFQSVGLKPPPTIWRLV